MAEPTLTRPLEFEIRTRPEYEPDYLRNSIRSQIFINGRETPIQARAVDDYFRYSDGEAYLAAAMRRHAPALEEAVIDEFVDHLFDHGKSQAFEDQQEQISNLIHLSTILRDDLTALTKDFDITVRWVILNFLAVVVTLALVAGIILL